MPRFISRLFALALLLGIFASPLLGNGASVVGAQDAATPCAPLTEEEATAFATAQFAAWNAHDVDAVLAQYDPSAISHFGIGFDSEGIDEIGAWQTAFFEAFPGVHGTIDRVWVAGDTVIVRYIAIGIQEADFMGIPASQDTVTWTGINVYQLACGKIVEQWGEADHFGRIEQQGVIPVGSPEAGA